MLLVFRIMCMLFESTSPILIRSVRKEEMSSGDLVQSWREIQMWPGPLAALIDWWNINQYGYLWINESKLYWHCHGFAGASSLLRVSLQILHTLVALLLGKLCDCSNNFLAPFIIPSSFPYCLLPLLWCETELGQHFSLLLCLMCYSTSCYGKIYIKSPIINHESESSHAMSWGL